MKFLMLSLALASLNAAAADAPAMPDRDAAAVAVRHYLDAQGDFCLGKTDWPVDISAIDERARGRDVLQMPVLEGLGLVHSGHATAMRVEGPGLDENSPPVPVAVKRYELTPLGERWMRQREVTVARAEGDVRVRERDLCAAHLALAEVVAVAPGAAPRSFVATYTYDATPAPWATSAEFQRAFPLAARVIDGSRRMQLKQAFAWKDGGWTPDGLAN
jgi:hypothetical protein